jgi:chromosome partitioning protein
LNTSEQFLPNEVGARSFLPHGCGCNWGQHLKLPAASPSTVDSSYTGFQLNVDWMANETGRMNDQPYSVRHLVRGVCHWLCQCFHDPQGTGRASGTHQNRPDRTQVDLVFRDDPMRTIAIMNQKGGVGKTTTSVNLAAALSRAGQRVCVLDLDPQGHASFHLGIEAGPETATIYDVFSDEATIDDVRQLVADNLSVVPSNIDLAAVEVELAGVQQREFLLRNALQPWEEQSRFDYVIMDCPPSLGILTINALSAAKEVLIPLQPHFFALQGLSKLFETTALVNRRLNRDLKVTGVALCLYESGTRLAVDVTEDLRYFLKESDSDTPWASTQIFRTKIRRNIKLAESPSFGQSIFDYAPKCPGAMDYTGLAEEVLAQAAAGGKTSDGMAAAA